MEHKISLGFFWNWYERQWRDVLTASENEIVTFHSREIICERPGKNKPERKSTSCPSSGPGKLLSDFVQVNGAAFDIVALEAFPDVDTHELSEDRYAAMHSKSRTVHPNRKRILDAEARSQRAFGRPDILPLWSTDTTERLR